MRVHAGKLVMSVDNPQVILRAIPASTKHEVNGKFFVVAPHTADVVKVLRNIGLKPPLIELKDFKYTGRHQPFDHQRTSTQFLVTHKRCFNLSDMGCVDCETEYLTPTGWKQINRYTEGDLVAQYNTKTKQAEFVKPTGYIKLPCDKMLRFKTSRGVDQKLSEEHRVLYVSPSGTLQVRSAAEVNASMAQAKMGWKGRFITTFAPPNTEGLALSDSQIRVQVAVIADGHFPTGCGTSNCIVRIKKERKKERLRVLLREARIEFKETMPEYESAKGFSIFKFAAPIRLKWFDYRFWAATEEQLRVLAEELPHWDGSERKAGGTGFYSNVKESADFAQYVYATTGRAANLSEYVREHDDGGLSKEYIVYARENNNPLYLVGCTSDGVKISNICEEVTTDGYKYCFAVPSTFLILRRNGCIFVTGNTGKTKSALWAAQYLKQIGAVKRILIACPLSVIGVWEEEAFNTVPHLGITRLLGSKARRLDVLAKGAAICVINHDGITTISEELEAAKFDLLILDEASAYRNAQTRRYKRLRKLTQTIPWLWLMTGTPVPKAPTDAFALVKLVNPSSFPGGFGYFKELTMTRVGGLKSFKWVAKPTAKEFVYQHLQPAVRFKKSECLDLPPVTHVNRMCDLTEQQKKAFKLMKARMVMEQHDGERITAANAAVKLLKLLQICCGVIKDNNGQHYKLDCSERLKLLDETVEEAGNKAIVFVPFLGVMDMVQSYLKKQGYTTGLVNGDVGFTARTKIFDEFQRGDTEVLIAHPRTAAHGLNLTASSTIIWYAPIFSCEQYLQANNRIDRPGQTQAMTVVHIIATPLEAGLYRALWNQCTMQEAVLSQYEGLIK